MQYATYVFIIVSPPKPAGATGVGALLASPADGTVLAHSRHSEGSCDLCSHSHVTESP